MSSPPSRRSTSRAGTLVPDALLVAALVALSPQPNPGRVVRIVGHDTVAVAGAHVTLHRVTAKDPGPVDSAVSDARGRFTFRLAPDSGVVYLVSAKWSGIEYFAAPFVVHTESPYPAATVVVSDTSSTIAIKLIARHLIVSPAAPDGTREVVDLFVLDNPGPETRVAAIALSPTWQARLPRFAANAHAGNSDFAADAVQALLALSKGDACAIAGRAKLSTWEKSGEEKHGLSVVAGEQNSKPTRKKS